MPFPQKRDTRSQRLGRRTDGRLRRSTLWATIVTPNWENTGEPKHPMPYPGFEPGVQTSTPYGRHKMGVKARIIYP